MNTQAGVKVVELCLSPDLGGLELYVLRVARWMAQTGIDYLAVVAPKGRLQALLHEESLPYRTLRVRLRWFPLAAARRLARWIDAEGIDLIHLHWTKDLNLAVLARRLAKRPVRIVQTRHMSITRAKHDWYHRALYRHLDLMLVITRRMQEQALRFLPLAAERVHVLYHGVPGPPPLPPDRCRQLRARAGVPPGRFVIGLIGRIEPGKGQQVLVDAMALLVRRGRDAHVLLVGHPMRSRYLGDLRRRIARLNLEDRVYYYGFHPRPQALMACFDCVVLTTFGEHFGLVLIEAMRAGVAVVGTDAGGVPEIIEANATGLLVPVGDATALADAIETLMREPALRRRLAKAGKAAADARFNEEQHFARLAEWLAE